MKIKDATVDDVAEVLELCRVMHAESKYASIPFDNATTLRTLHDAISDPMQTLIIAERRGECIVGFVGMTMMQYHFSPKLIAMDSSMYVLPQYRHTLAFAGLLRAAERWAILKGSHSILFGLTAAPDTEKAMRAYCKMGYAEWGVTLRKEL